VDESNACKKLEVAGPDISPDAMGWWFPMGSGLRYVVRKVRRDVSEILRGEGLLLELCG
jgi:hypothetical protein